MIQWTTPTIIWTFPVGTDFSDVVSMVCTLKQRDLIINKSFEELTIADNEVSFKLSQEESGKFFSNLIPPTLLNQHPNNILVQLNWLYSDGNRGCSNIAVIEVNDNLFKEKME